MSKTKKEKFHFPFWGTPINLITGLDPLGLQLTSEAIYSSMLPGLTNLTNRLRYYGFYCWLIDFYLKKEKKGNSKHQHRFIRRAELMIALLMQNEQKEVLQITGSNFATRMIEKSTHEYFNLKEGADVSDKKVYWKYPSGAFGQYYYGAMRDISLITTEVNEEGDSIFKPTSSQHNLKVSGQQLAKAFDCQLEEQAKDLFYRNILQGILYKRDIPYLFSFFKIDIINPQCEEWSLYATMLLDKDFPGREEEDITHYRRETIRLLTENGYQKHKAFNWHAFIFSCYQSKTGIVDKEKNDTVTGWYAYQLNEYWQYACGTIFWAMLEFLKGEKRELFFPHFLSLFAEKVTGGLIEVYNGTIQKNTPLKEVISQLSIDETEIENKISPKEKIISNAQQGFLLLFCIYKNNQAYLESLDDYLTTNKMKRDGNMIDGLKNIQVVSDHPVADFIKDFTLRQIIYRHQMVAIRKMGNGMQATHKFLIDEQYIRWIESVSPRHTSPRMDTVKNLLHDLCLINKEAHLDPILTPEFLEKV